MIQRLQFCVGEGFDPYLNLAVEQYLLEHVEDGCCVLYLWQNQNTVVIGRNQNAWKECRTTLLTQEGGHLARRLSGGGAVFHDVGNLNFTFLLSADDYDVSRQLSVILEACRSLGIHAEASGRNDLLADGRKFSGNAFYQSGGHAYHHGTLLVDADTGRMGRYLCPSKAKLAAKGVDSVRSRVVNLRELCPGLTIHMMQEALKDAFGHIYGLPLEPIHVNNLDRQAIANIRERNKSWEWIYGRSLPFSFSCQGQFAWGNLQMKLNVEDGLIQTAQVYSDAMDWEIPPRIEQALQGCRFTMDALQQQLEEELGQGALLTDLCQLLSDQGI